MLLHLLLPSKKKDKLKAYVALVNHNISNGSTAYQIVHTFYGNYCHNNATQTSQLEEMENDACIIVGYHNKVSSSESLLTNYSKLE